MPTSRRRSATRCAGAVCWWKHHVITIVWLWVELNGDFTRTSARRSSEFRMGLIGDIYMARWVLTKLRESIGFKQPEHMPAWLHWDFLAGTRT